MPVMRRYHPFLPTVAEAARTADNTHTPYLSDHVPCYIEIPLSDNSDKTVRVATLNVMENDAANGFSEPGSIGARWGEDESEAAARYERIALALKNFLEKNTVDCIALQEIVDSVSPCLLSKIREIIPSQYQPAMTTRNGEEMVVDFQGCVTLYNTETMAPSERMKNAGNQLNEGNLGGCIGYFHHRETGIDVNLLNVHAGFSENPEGHETHITNFLTNKEKNSVAIVVGDFNCTVAPLDTNRRNITTSAATTNFRYSGEPVESRLPQGGYAIDGAFFSSAGSHTCRQAEIQHICLDFGFPYSDAELLPLNDESVEHEGQRLEINEPRLAIMVDPVYQTERFCVGYTFPEYESILRESLNQKGIKMRIAKTLNNDTRIAICGLSKETRNYLIENNPSCQVKFCRDSNPPLSYIAIKPEDFPRIHELLQERFDMSEAINKIDTMGRLDAFKKIYTALRDGQKSIFKKKDFLDSADEITVDIIEANIKRNPKSRTAAAWALAETYENDCYSDNQDLLKAIYTICFEKSNPLSKSSLSGTTLFRSSKVKKSLEGKEITPDDIDNHSRAGKIATALGPKR